MSFDPRLLRVGIQIGDTLWWYEGLSIEVNITKTSGATANDANIKVTNITKLQRNELLTQTSPFNKSKERKQLFVEAGRQSYGYSQIFVGDITVADVTQPPDIGIVLRAQTNAHNRTQIISKSYGATVSCKRVATDIAESMGLALQFEIEDKQLASYAFVGAKSTQLDRLNEIGRVQAYVDDNKLVVQELGKGLTESRTTGVLSAESGMVGIPEVTEQGVKVMMLFEPASRLGQTINVVSKMNPAADGEYIIFKMTYELSNREDAFYTIIEAYKNGYYTQQKTK